MRIFRVLSSDAKLFSAFLAVILILSLCNLVSNRILLHNLELESERTAGERMTSVVSRFDEHFSTLHGYYIALHQSPVFQQYLTGARERYAQIAVWNHARQIFVNTAYVESFILFIGDEEDVVTRQGIYPREYFFEKYYGNSTYDLAFWLSQRGGAFTQWHYPQAVFQQTLLPGHVSFQLMPMALKPYGNSRYMLLMLLDMDAIARAVDPNYAEDLFIYAGDTLLYSSGADLPSESVALLSGAEQESFSATGDTYIITRRSAYNNLIYMKVLPASSVKAQVENSSLASALVAGAALLVGVLLAALTVRRFNRPLHHLVSMFGGESGERNAFEYVTSNVSALVKQQEHNLRQIAQRDEVLSEFLLQSQLKNVYVNFQPGEDARALTPDSRVFCIVYFKVCYRDTTLRQIDMKPNQITFMIKEILREILSQRFENLLVFQMEEHQFVAKVGLLNPGEMAAQMADIMRMLENEEEYAYFTVVQSQCFPADQNIAEVYADVLRTAQYALVRDKNQFLLAGEAPPAQGTRQRLSAEQRRQLGDLLRERDTEGARDFVSAAIECQLAQGINRVSMVMLVNGIASVAIRALEERFISVPATLREDAMYDAITRCDTAEEFLREAIRCAESAIAFMEAAGDENLLDLALRNIRQYIEKHYTRDFSMQELGEAVGMSKSYLSTYFKAKTGTNLSEYIQRLRVQKAVALIEESGELIQDIGSMVGIDNPNTFIRLFKKYVGMSPGRYRKELVDP